VRARLMLAIVGCLLAACTRLNTSAQSTATTASPAFLFSYFTRNGEDGVHLAYSRDGINWAALNGGRSVITPAITGAGRGWQEWNTTAALMRDPSILRGPDGMFHLVWTIAWTDHGIGVAHSRDLIHWSTQTRVPVMEHEPDALNAWAPDLFYDDATQQFVIVWATAIPGRFPATDSLAQRTSRGHADHRLYYVTTKDFVTYSHAALLYDGGFCAIDGNDRQTWRPILSRHEGRDILSATAQSSGRIECPRDGSLWCGVAIVHRTRHRGSLGTAFRRLLVRLLRRVHTRSLWCRSNAGLRALGAILRLPQNPARHSSWIGVSRPRIYSTRTPLTRLDLASMTPSSPANEFGWTEPAMSAINPERPAGLTPESASQRWDQIVPFRCTL
jgi:hypothetical protein